MGVRAYYCIRALRRCKIRGAAEIAKGINRHLARILA
jgi:hypothetical protein